MPGKGRVAHNACLCLAQGFTRCGVGREIYRREEALYRAWGAKEIHTEAACDALKSGVWFDFGFKVAPDELNSLGVIWRELQAEILKRSGNQLRQLGETWDTWEPEFRRFIGERESVPMYRVL
ncbi:MAG: hypothetical protein QM704_25485 [Anaeromyxobacteraceae bacterium]